MAFDLCVIPVATVPYLSALQTRQFNMTEISAYLVSGKLTRDQCRSLTPETFSTHYGTSASYGSSMTRALQVRSSVSSEINLAITAPSNSGDSTGYTIVIKGLLEDQEQERPLILGVCVSDEPIVLNSSLRLFVNIEETNNVFRLSADFDGMVTQGLLDNILETYVTTDTDQDITGEKVFTESNLIIGDDTIKHYSFKHGQEFIIGTQAASTNAWTGVSVQDTLYDGMCINFYLPYAGTTDAATLTLTLANGNTTAAIPVKYRGNNNVTTTFPVGSIIQLTYCENKTIGSNTITGWFADSNYVSSTTVYYERNRIAGRVVAGSTGLYALQPSLLVDRDGNKYVSITTSSTAHASGTPKACTTLGFYPESILTSTTSYTSGNSGSNTIYRTYTLTVNQCFGTASLTAYRPVYLVCTFNRNDGKFYLDTTQWWSQTVPQQDNGKLYIYLGITATTTTFTLDSIHPILCYKDGRVQEVTYASLVTDDRIDALEESIPQNLSDLEDDLGVLTEHQSLAAYPTSASYNTSTKKIEFKNASNTALPNLEIDASAFIKDGMVDTVEIQNSNLVVTFNTDAGKEDISIPLSDIFNPNNYYTKTETDSAISDAIEELGLGDAAQKDVQTTMTASSSDLPTSSAVATYITNQGFAHASDIHDATLTIKKNSDDAGDTFTANASVNKTINLGLGEAADYDVDPFPISDASSGNLVTTISMTQWVRGQNYATMSDLPTVNNAQLTIQKNGTNVATFTANASSGVTANITVPTKTSDITNDSGFVSSSDLGSAAFREAVDIMPDASSGDLPSSVAIKSWVNSAIQDKADYIQSLIPSVYNATLTIKKNANDTGGTFTANASSNKTINLGLGAAADKAVDTSIVNASSGNLPTVEAVTGWVWSQLDDYARANQIPTVNNATLTIKKNSNDAGDTFTANASTDKTINLGLHTVATSGSYNDLNNKPTIPTVNDATLTIKKNSSDTGDTFTANASTDKTINLGLGAAAVKGVDTALSSASSGNLPTTGAVMDYIDTQLNDVAHTSDIPTVGNATITLRKNANTSAGNFTTNATSNKTINFNLGAAADKAVDTTISSTSSTNLPTTSAVVDWVNAQGFLTSAATSSNFVVADFSTQSPSGLSNVTDYRPASVNNSDNPHYSNNDLSFKIDATEVPANGTSFDVYINLSKYIGSVQVACNGNNYLYPIYFRGNSSVHCPTIPAGSVLRMTLYNNAFYCDFYDLADFGKEHEAYVYVGKVPIDRVGSALEGFSGLVGMDETSGKFSQLFTVSVTQNGAQVTTPSLKDGTPIYACFQGDCFAAHPKVPFGNILRIRDEYYVQNTLQISMLPFTFYPFTNNDTVDAHVVVNPNSEDEYAYFHMDNCPVYILPETNLVVLGNVPEELHARLIGFLCEGANNAGMLRLVDNDPVPRVTEEDYAKTYAGVWDSDKVDQSSSTYSAYEEYAGLSVNTNNLLVGVSKTDGRLVPFLRPDACGGGPILNQQLDWDAPIYVMFEGFKCYSAYPYVNFKVVLYCNKREFSNEGTFPNMSYVLSGTDSTLNVAAEVVYGESYWAYPNYPVFVSDYSHPYNSSECFCIGIPKEVQKPSGNLRWRLLGYTTDRPGYIRLTQDHPYLKDFINRTSRVNLSDYTSTFYDASIGSYVTPSAYVNYFVNSGLSLQGAVQELIHNYGEEVFKTSYYDGSTVYYCSTDSDNNIIIYFPEATNILFGKRLSFRLDQRDYNGYYAEEVAFIDENGVYHGRVLEADTSVNATRSRYATELNVSNGVSTLASFKYGSSNWDTDKGINPTSSNALSLGSNLNVWKDIYGYTLHAWGNNASSGLRLCDGDYEATAYSSITGYQSGSNGQMKFHHYNASDGIDYVVISTGPNTADTSTTAATLKTEPQSTGTWTVGSSSKKLAAVYANTFYGDLSGTATKAIQDGSGNTITSNYASNISVETTSRTYRTWSSSGIGSLPTTTSTRYMTTNLLLMSKDSSQLKSLGSDLQAFIANTLTQFTSTSYSTSGYVGGIGCLRLGVLKRASASGSGQISSTSYYGFLAGGSDILQVALYTTGQDVKCEVATAYTFSSGTWMCISLLPTTSFSGNTTRYPLCLFVRIA